MGIFNKGKEVATVVDSTGGLVEKIGDAFDKNFTNQEEKLEARNKMMEIFANLVSEINTLRQAVIVAEANGSVLQRNWRPIMMLTFGGIIVCTWMVFPIINIFAHSADLSLLIKSLQDAVQFWDVVELGLGGYVIGRSVEKVVDSASKNITITTGKREK
jgi:hypothetical protein